MKGKQPPLSACDLNFRNNILIAIKYLTNEEILG